jgi:CheY-like chemotaxis protein
MMNAISEVILNVNDHEATLYATSRVLRKEGFTVLEAKTGEEAWEIVQREHARYLRGGGVSQDQTRSAHELDHGAADFGDQRHIE